MRRQRISEGIVSDQPLQLICADKHGLVNICGQAEQPVELANGQSFLQSQVVEKCFDGLEHGSDIDIEAAMLIAEERFKGLLCLFPIGFFFPIQPLLVAVKKGDAQCMGLQRFKFFKVFEHGGILLDGAGGDSFA
jgi:hypothetical protein